MNRSLDQILDSHSDDQIDMLVDFLRRCPQARQSATDRPAKDSD